mmetsp:Transcript_77785/g.154537  ORF Transcript_77785/g.154537 Transcript_77785/m.154537 type:complete len:316 (-) Transcript_77785:462-1409(-)
MRRICLMTFSTSPPHARRTLATSPQPHAGGQRFPRCSPHPRTQGRRAVRSATRVRSHIAANPLLFPPVTPLARFAVYANAKPLNRAPTASAAKPSSMPLERTAPASHPTPAVVGPTGAAPCTSSPHASSSVGDAGDGSDAASDPAQRSQPPLATLRPRLNTSMYDVQPDPEEPVTGSVTGSVTGAGGMMYEQPAGPVMGPQVVEDGAFEGYAEPGFDMSDGKVMDISQADLRKVMGDAKQYDFAPAPQPEVKIAANFWNRSSGAVEAHYQPSSLQKRKHQINSLAADAAARAAEIAARGSKGMKSKAETAAKYGW